VVILCVRLVKTETVRVRVSLSRETKASGTVTETVGPDQMLRFDLDFLFRLLHTPQTEAILALEKAQKTSAAVRRPQAVASAGMVGCVRQPSRDEMKTQTDSPDAWIPVVSTQITQRLLLSCVRGNEVKFLGKHCTRLVETHGFPASRAGHFHASIDLPLLFTHSMCASPLTGTHIPDVLCQIIVEYVATPNVEPPTPLADPGTDFTRMEHTLA
jgi:hypothetical protein